MIDWPNALVGFALGVAATLLFWVADRIRAGREQQDEFWESWKVAMKDLEILMWKRETRAADIYAARTRYPIDRWRRVLKDRGGFLLLERVEVAYTSIEHSVNLFPAEASAEDTARFLQVQDGWASARVAFANYSRNAQSEGYDRLVLQEDRQRNRRDFVRNPIRTAQRLRHNARVKKPNN